MNPTSSDINCATRICALTLNLGKVTALQKVALVLMFGFVCTILFFLLLPQSWNIGLRKP